MEVWRLYEVEIIVTYTSLLFDCNRAQPTTRRQASGARFRIISINGRVLGFFLFMVFCVSVYWVPLINCVFVINFHGNVNAARL